MRAIVQGRVQGVGYRWFVRDEARRLGLHGSVRNLPDGRSVQVDATGEKSSLQDLVDALRRGPAGAAVRDVTVDWDTVPNSTSSDFEISP